MEIVVSIPAEYEADVQGIVEESGFRNVGDYIAWIVACRVRERQIQASHSKLMAEFIGKESK